MNRDEKIMESNRHIESLFQMRPVWRFMIYHPRKYPYTTR